MIQENTSQEPRFQSTPTLTIYVNLLLESRRQFYLVLVEITFRASRVTLLERLTFSNNWSFHRMLKTAEYCQ